MRRSSIAAAAVGAVVLSLAVGFGPAGAAPAPGATPGSAASTPDAAAAKVPSLVRQLAAKLRTEQSRSGGATPSAKARQDRGGDLVGLDAGGALDLQLHATAAVGSTQLAQLRGLGVTVESSSAQFAAVPGAALPPAGLVHAAVPVDKLDAVAALPWVAAVRPVSRPQVDAGPITSEGVALHRAGVAHRIGLTGRGQRVGAMSDGVTHLADSVAKGELPPDVRVIDPGDGDEGTGMLEIVHDMAPGAKLLFTGTGETLADHVGGLRKLAAAGANLITEDLAFDDEPAFQQGLAASTAEALARSGVFVSSSPATWAPGTRRGCRRSAPAAAGRHLATRRSARPAGRSAPHNAVAVAGGTDNSFDLLLGQDGVILATLQWSEPRAIFPTPGRGGFTDVNLYLLDTDRPLPRGQQRRQANGVGDTIEQVLYDSAELGAGNHPLKLVVDVAGTSSAVAPPLIDLRWRTGVNGSLAIDTPSRAGSLNPDSNYLGRPRAPARPTPASPPTRRPCRWRASAPAARCRSARPPSARTAPSGRARAWPGRGSARRSRRPGRPRTASRSAGRAASRTRTSARRRPTGQCLFFGTSAAAPSAAGVAAVVRQELGGRLPPRLLNLALAKLAVDRGDPGRDNLWGAGVLRVLPV